MYLVHHLALQTWWTYIGHVQDGKIKRRVGRPIAYSGDPNSPELEPGQRRVVLRRIANRESARRVRARRQDELDKMSQKVNLQLQTHTNTPAGLPQWPHNMTADK